MSEREGRGEGSRRFRDPPVSDRAMAMFTSLASRRAPSTARAARLSDRPHYPTHRHTGRKLHAAGTFSAAHVPTPPTS